MENLFITRTDDTPEIKFNPETGTISFSGLSLPEDVKLFYTPVLAWLKSFFEKPKNHIKVHFNMTYFNTATSKIFLDIMRTIKNATNNGFDIDIIWSYDEDDEEMQEAGEDLADMVGLNIVFNAKPVMQN